MIEMNNVGKRYGGFKVLTDSTTRASKGEVVEVTASGAKVTQLRSKIGMVFRHFELFPHMTVRNSLCLTPEKVLGRNCKEAEQRRETLLTRVGMIDHIAKFPGQLSGASSSASQLPAHWRWIPSRCFLTNRHPRLTPR